MRVTTLDAAIQKYGIPGFVKIDVEGYEFDVLKGLGTQIPVISFEYTPEMTADAIKCLERISQLGTYEFKISFGESMLFHSDVQMPKDEMTEFLLSNRSGEFGDIYAIACSD